MFKQVKQLLAWHERWVEKEKQEQVEKMNEWNKKPFIFKTQFKCTDCAFEFEEKFREGDRISWNQAWTGTFAVVISQSPELNGFYKFIQCPLCNGDSCKTLESNPISQKKEKNEE